MCIRDSINAEYGDKEVDTMTKGNSFQPHWCSNWQLASAAMDCAGKGTTQCTLGGRLRESDYVGTIFQWQQILFLILSMLLFFLAKHVYRIPYLMILKSKRAELKESEVTDDQLEFKTGNKLLCDSNTAVGISFSGYVAALAMVFLATIGDLDQGEEITTAKYTASGTSDSFSDWSQDEWNEVQGENVGGSLAYTLIGMLMLTIARFVNDFVTVGVEEATNIAIKKQNASGILEAGSYVATGMIIAACVSGRGSNWGQDIGTTLIYFVIGQVLYIISVKKFVVLSKYDDFNEIENNNCAVSVAVVGDVIANAVIISGSIYMDTSLIFFAFMLGVGVVANYLSAKFADCALLPQEDLEKEIEVDGNWGAALVAGAVQVAIAIMLVALPSTTCDQLDLSFKDIMFGTDNFSRAFQWYQLFLVPVIPLIVILPRYLYPLGLKLSGGIPDLDFLKDNEEDVEDPKMLHRQFTNSPTSEPAGVAAPAPAARSSPMLPAGTGNGVKPKSEEDDGVKMKPGATTGTQEDWFREAVRHAKNKETSNEHISPKMDIDELLTHHDNKSIAISFAGYILGIALLFRGTVSSAIGDFPPDYDFDQQMLDLIPLLVLLAVGLMCLVICHVINDKIIVPNIRNDEAISAGAKFTAVGIVEAGSFIATGQILGAASYNYIDTEDGSTWGEALFFQLFWFFLGQFAICAISEISNKINGGVAKINVQKRNTAAGIFLALRLIATSTLVQNPISQSDSVVTFFIMLVLGAVYVGAVKYVFRLSLAAGSFFEDSEGGASKLSMYEIVIAGYPFKANKNWGNALVEGTVMIANAAIFGSFLRGCECYDQWVIQLA
eukprot:TRINITY_DN9033_c0_g3_i2.p1 TRINITY_DN9033_c0_g3~~TRINITY_DN9033_c0_g3_i2.p1  ORF type:complete len:836 (-),score=246.81 TRINITY_DN9033_c0_g3_i2:245-2752(-)